MIRRMRSVFENEIFVNVQPLSVMIVFILTYECVIVF